MGPYSYIRSKPIQQARGVRSKTSVGSSPRSDEATPFALRDQPNRNTRYDWENYGTPLDSVCLDESRPINEPARALIHNGKSN